MFSNTPSTRALFEQISKQNLSLGLADWDSLDEDMKSKMTDSTGEKISIEDFRKHFSDHNAHMSDLTCSLGRMEVSAKNSIFKDSDRSLDSDFSMTSAFKKYLSENTISEIDANSIDE